jgi:hypothetical protein
MGGRSLPALVTRLEPGKEMKILIPPVLLISIAHRRPFDYQLHIHLIPLLSCIEKAILVPGI